ncbi:hypothetical protein FB451DRAFT_1011648, partial [Mycena latifolia]
VGETMPCGFCGLSGNPACQPYLKVRKQVKTVESNCPHAYNFRYVFAERGSDSTPCRNVPVVYSLCKNPDLPRYSAEPAIWRYNMPEHLEKRHPEYASPNSPGGIPLPYVLWKSIEITEGIAMGIPKDCIPIAFTDFEAPST